MYIFIGLFLNLIFSFQLYILFELKLNKLNMENNNLECQEKLEKTIIKVIRKIRKSSRPCYQNILTHLNRGEYKDLQMEDLKSKLELMLEKNIINNNNEEHESFYVTEEIEVPKSDENEETTNSLESFVDENFYSVLINRIQFEVNIAIEKALGTNMLPAKNETIKINESKYIENENKNKMLIEKLCKQIDFLQNELVNKNEIIKTLMNDKSGPNTSHQLNTENTDETTQSINLESNLPRESESNDKDEQNFQNVPVKKKNKSRTITILGDSILKDIKSYKIRNGLKTNDRVYVKSFPGANIKDMHEYAIPSMRHNPNLIALHVGTNDLRSTKSSNDIAQEIIELGMKIQTEENDIIISAIVARKDDNKLEEKRCKVNEILKSKTSELGLGFIEHNEINPQIHCNYGGLHLNFDGTFILGSNFVDMINA